ncbi:MAG: hypothetical protein Q8Q42_02920 [Nanoarchaeota archaeon]|nr:hypothetical protein [Nanoarchaeota archaeon]
MGEVNFNQALEEWIEHCRDSHIRFSSFAEPVKNCEPYRKIISMGYKALPLVRQVYDMDISDNFELSIVIELGLASVVRDIVGDDFSIPEKIRGRISAIEDYTKKWLDENMDNYLSRK